MDTVEVGSSPLASALADRWPSHAAYVAGFLTIGIIWVNHHHLFAVVERTNNSFLMLNVLALFWLIPGSGPQVERLRSSADEQAVG